MIGEFVAGVGLLVRGFGLWRTRPRLMALGLIPAFIAFALLLAALIPFAFAMGPIADWATPFADAWASPWRELFRGAISIVLFIAALALAGAVFTALALTIGDPFYQRIWRAVEEQLGQAPERDEGSFWTVLAEGIRLALLGVLVAVIVLLCGLLPLIGGAIGAVLGIVLTGRLLARELTGRAMDARDLDPADRVALFSSSRARVLGFGVATQLCFLIPLGAVVTMPAAVAGATELYRTMAERAGTADTASRPEPSGTADA